MVVHVAVLRNFDPLELDVAAFANEKSAAAWCEARTSEEPQVDLFVFSVEVQD